MLTLKKAGSQFIIFVDLLQTNFQSLKFATHVL